MGIPMPAPAPAVNAWDKPINLATTNSKVAIHTGTDSHKYDKADQHDSGIDISEPQNSAGSSTRSSPSAENKLKSDDLMSKVRIPCSIKIYYVIEIKPNTCLA